MNVWYFSYIFYVSLSVHLSIILVNNSWPVYQAVTYTEWYIPDDVLIHFDSPDDEHCVARNMKRSEINTLKKLRQVGY